ncbi:MAG: hypothetical protein Q7S40_28885 [Opitutaceae bacterium]|nr:hypothetical protein [Opitutaceae bacterium]
MRLLLSALFLALAGPTLWSQPPGAPRGGVSAPSPWQRYAAQSHAIITSLNQPDSTALPPPPEGVTDLQFSEFFGPIGDRGLEYSAKLRALAGQPVRLTGFMVREQDRTPGLFRLAGWPVSVATKGLCVGDNSPATAVHVMVPACSNRLVPYRPGRIVLAGRIEIGPRPEADGRNSTVRLILDAEGAAPFTTAVEPDPPKTGIE